MTADTSRHSARRQLEQRGLHRVVQSPPLDAPGVEITGVGQSLCHLFRDELMRRRVKSSTAKPEVSHG